MTTATCPSASLSWGCYLQKVIALYFVQEIAGQLGIRFVGKVKNAFFMFNE
jgi:hypothetical protein